MVDAVETFGPPNALNAMTLTAAQRAQAAIEEDLAWLNAGADPDGCAPAGSERAQALGFTAERFQGYVWLSGTTCWLSLVVSLQPNQGHLSELISQLASRGYEIRVPNPTPDMQARLARKGFAPDALDALTWVLPAG